MIKVYDSVIKRISKLREEDHFNDKEIRRIILKFYNVLQIISVLGLPQEQTKRIEEIK